jgi:hypothetical protein
LLGPPAVGGRGPVGALMETAQTVGRGGGGPPPHAAMLRAGFPGLAADPLPLVERLVFTDATRAVEWHHTGVRLDLLVRAPAGWLHVPLNDERSMWP